MPGFGTQPFGSSYFGLGTETPTSAPCQTLLPDQTTGLPSGATAIDPITGDHVIDDDGCLLGMTPAEQAVLLVAKTVKGSSAVRELGNDLGSIKVVTDDVNLRVRNILEQAFSSLTRQKIVQLLSITSSVIRPGAVAINVRWKDLATEQEHTTIL